MQLNDLMDAQALRSILPLEPIDGPGGRIFPPTYPIEDGKNEGRRSSQSEKGRAQHVIEELPNGQKRALVDSVASQANRQEAALVAARAAGIINFSDVYVDLSMTDAGLDRISATEMPHRLSDAILRDSEIDGMPFAKSKLGKSILEAQAGDYSVFLETSPTTLLFGCWFSQHKLARPVKIQRSAVSEIWADDVVLGKSVGSRIDPLGITRGIPIYSAADGGDWTLDETQAIKPKGGKIKSVRPSEINHGNIAPTVKHQGLTAASITLRWALPLAAIRRLHFGSPHKDAAGQAYIVALGILGRVLDHDTGYSLRSRCDLISSGLVSLDIIARDGTVTSIQVETKMALLLLAEAEKGMRAAGLDIHQKIMAKPGARLISLIAMNKKLQSIGVTDDEEEVQT